MKEAFRLHVCETKNRLREEIDRLRVSTAEHAKVPLDPLSYVASSARSAFLCSILCSIR
jgi:hypothetical protein